MPSVFFVMARRRNNRGLKRLAMSSSVKEGCQPQKGSLKMCDYSLQNVSSRPATVGDQLVTRDFRTGTRGFADVECPSVAVCVLPGTEIAFAEGLPVARRGLLGWRRKPVRYYTA